MLTMTMQRFAACLVLVAWAVAGAAAQSDTYYEEERERRDPPPAGFFPTERMIDLAINRVTDEMARQYGFDDDQLWQTRELIKQRVPDWMQDNRGELQGLMTQYIEAILGDEPPPPEEVADWAQRALPLLNDFRGIVYDVSDDMRGYLTEEQQIIMDGELAAMNVAMDYTTARFQLWSQGGYDWETEWPRSDTFRETERERRQQLEREAEEAKIIALGGDPSELEPAEGAAGDGAAELAGDKERQERSESTPLVERTTDEWEQYVANFIRRYNLDEAQQNSARKALKRAQASRDRYLKKRLDDIQKMQVDLKIAQSDEQRARLKERYERLTAPLDRYFQKLKDDLNRLPNRAQRRQAAYADIQARAESEARASGKAEPEEE
jgi:hypothetical protein